MDNKAFSEFINFFPTKKVLIYRRPSKKLISHIFIEVSWQPLPPRSADEARVVIIETWVTTEKYLRSTDF